MPKNFKKLLVCIVATFGITAMVFSCCKKIGLCASDSTLEEISSYPLPYNNFQGLGGFYLPDSVYENVVNDSLNRVSGYPFGVFSSEVASDNSYIIVRVIYMPDDWGGNARSGTVPNSMTVGPNSVLDCLEKGYNVYKIYANGSFEFVSDSFVNGYRHFYTSLDDVCPSNGFIKKSFKTSGWAIYLTNYGKTNTLYYQNSNTDIPVWEKTNSSIVSGHTKGGVLTNYVDSDELLENSSELPKVDTSAPSNSSSIPDWLQKILNGVGKLNQSIQGGFLTIGDYIGKGFEKVGEWFQHLEDSIGGFFDRVKDSLDDIIDTIEGLKDGSTVAQAQAVWEDEFDNSIFQDFVDLKGSIEDDILTPIRNANAPSTLSFTIPLITVNVPRLINSGGSVSTATNNVYLFGQSVTLDFSWYSRSISGGVFNGSSIRDYLVPIIATFLYVTMVVHLLFKIPSFLSGSSGFSDTLHTVVVSFNGSKFKKA